MKRSTGIIVRFSLACCLTAALVRPVFSQRVPAPVRWSAGSTMPVLVHAGTMFTVDIHAAIDPGWHLYALQEPNGGPMPTEIALSKGDRVELLRVGQSHPRDSIDTQFQLRTMYFEQAAKFTLHMRAEPVKDTFDTTLHALIRYQACNDRQCLPPQEASIIVPYRIRP